MNKILNLFFIIIFCSGCSLNKNSKFWTSETITEVGEKNLNDLKNKIREKMQTDFQTLSNLKMRREASETLLKSSKFDIPSKMIDSEFGYLKSNSNDKK